MNVATFPYSVHDEPNEEWTIEELLHWCLLQSQHKTMSKRDEIMNAYQELFDIGKKEILQLQSEVCKMHHPPQEGGNKKVMESNDDDDVMKSVHCDNDNNGENEHPNIANTATEMTNNKVKKTKINNPSKPSIIEIQITSGPHKGSSFTLKPGLRKPCWVGRSTSKKFRDNGISLKQDEQVSTTHGKFHIHPASATNGKLVYTDTGSTNGTLYNNEEIEDQVPLELVDGMELVLGGSNLLIHLR